MDAPELFQIADNSRNKWEEIGIYLGFEAQELSGYEQKFRDDLNKRLRAVILAWKLREDSPTVGKVAKACKEAKVGPAVRRALQRPITGDA